MWTLLIIWFAADGQVLSTEYRGMYGYQEQCEGAAEYIERHMSSTTPWRAVCVEGLTGDGDA